MHDGHEQTVAKVRKSEPNRCGNSDPAGPAYVLVDP
jgi:hypothetical protein